MGILSVPLACLIDWTVRFSDIINWVIVVALAMTVYLLFQRHQIRIARHSIVRQLEEDAAALFRAQSALEEIVLPNQTVQSEHREFRAVLDNMPPWAFEKDLAVPVVSGWPSAKFKFINGQRFWLIRVMKRPDGTQVSQYLASQALQETLLWFRRIERARKDKVITENELLDLCASLSRWHSLVAQVTLPSTSRAPRTFARWFR